MPLLAFALELKTLTPEGSFSGIASTYGDPPDEGGDVVAVGAFTETLKAQGPSRPLLADHRDVIGTVTLQDSAAGLLCKGQLTMTVQKARETRDLAAAGAIRGLSIGYTAVGGGELRGDGVRVLKHIKLYEISLTAFPMNTAATIIGGMKSQHELEIKSALDDFRRAILNAF